MLQCPKTVPVLYLVLDESKNMLHYVIAYFIFFKDLFIWKSMKETEGKSFPSLADSLTTCPEQEFSPGQTKS